MQVEKMEIIISNDGHEKVKDEKLVNIFFQNFTHMFTSLFYYNLSQKNMCNTWKLKLIKYGIKAFNLSKMMIIINCLVLIDAARV